jgi:hypothetical protein
MTVRTNLSNYDICNYWTTECQTGPIMTQIRNFSIKVPIDLDQQTNRLITIKVVDMGTQAQTIGRLLRMAR